MKYHSIVLIAGLLFATLGHAQEKSNKGKEFWLGYGYMYSFNNEPPVNQQDLVLYLSAEEPATVTVSVNGTSWSQTVSLPANTVNASITVPKSGADDARIFNEGLFARGVHIVSDTPIVAYAHLYNTMVSGATMLIPVETYGYKYYSLNYSQNTSATTPPSVMSAPNTQNGPDWYSWFYVVAAENNTRIEITPSDTTRGGWLPGQTYTVNLNKGEIYNVMGKLTPNNNASWAASKDLTGSKVVSVPGNDGNCHPVAMFSGSSGIRLCKGDGGEYMQQQVFPTQAWGTRYLTYHTMNNTSTNINDGFKNFYRIGVSDPTTVVKRNGVVLTNLVNNFYYEYLDSLGGDYIEADKPILVAQYTPGGNRCYNMSQFAYGDPEMFYLSAMEQGKNDILFYATRKAFIDYNYLNVVIPTAGIPSLQLDGAAFLPSNIIAHPNMPGYSVAVARMLGAAGQHRLKSDSNFTATVYGLGYFESYGYNVGTNIKNLNYYGSFKNVYGTLPVDTFTCPKTPVRLSVKIGYSATSITWKLSQVPGITPSADITVPNPVPVSTESINGRTYYTYTLQQDVSFLNVGTYFVPITYSATVIENCSQSEKAEVKVVVKPGPISDFSVTGACLGDSIHFTGTPSANAFNLVNYTWSFDDNTTATGITTVKKFSSAGPHDVRFRVFADNGCAGDTTKTVNILASPVSNFGVTTPACSGAAVVFTDSSTTSDGSLTNWNWIFGDGTSISVSNNNPVSHQYGSAGTNYIASLVTTSSNGCKSDTAKKTVTIVPGPTAKFGYDKNICLGDSIRFTDSSAISVGNIISWNWNMGDGTVFTASNNNPFYHPYSATGVYTVSLVTKSDNGCKSDTFKLNVSVNNRPSATFTINGRACVDSLQNLISSVAFNSSNPANYYWSFGNGQTFTSNTTHVASHTFSTAASNITIKHVVSYGPGCSSDTAEQTIPLVSENPVAQFSISPNIVCEKGGVQFSTTIQTGNLSWAWNFGNGTGTMAPPFTRTYHNAGNYNIGLVVSTPQGCKSLPAVNSLTVTPTPVVNAGTDKFIQKGISVTLDASIANPSNYNFSWTPVLYLNNPTVLNPIASPDSTIMYEITATDKNTNCFDKDTVTVNIIYDLYVPNAFSPNGDGKNDVWGIPGMALYPEGKVTIYNRWGQVVYTTKNYHTRPWNGTLNGTSQGNETFVYFIELPGKKEIIKGTVTIIR